MKECGRAYKLKEGRERRGGEGGDSWFVHNKGEAVLKTKSSKTESGVFIKRVKACVNRARLSELGRERDGEVVKGRLKAGVLQPPGMGEMSENGS